MQLSFSTVSVVVFLLSGGIDIGFVSPWLRGGNFRVFGVGVGNGHVGKKGLSVGDYGTDSRSTCGRESDFEISQNYIIRTKDSEANGATFLTAVLVRSFDICLEQCCLKEDCDTSIFVQIDAYDEGSDRPNCFLFECRPGGETGDNLCLFTYKQSYVSSIKKANGGFQNPVVEPVHLPVTTQAVALPTTTQAPPDNDPFTSCGAGYFECVSGQCIHASYVCNELYDCDDRSDEYGCDSPSFPEEQDNAPAVPVDDTASKAENEPVPENVVTVVAPLNNVAATTISNTSVKPEKTEETQEENANFAANSDLVQAGGGGGMPPASSAILPLVIGLIITVCLLLMVGCRLRYMNQRLRYGRLKTNAQDADYLINGMYL